MTTMQEALIGLARRMPRVVREHEVLRVAAWMPVEDRAQAAEIAIREVLRWAQKRSGSRFPDAAWAMESFEHLSGGRNSSCIRLKTNEADLWTIRADDPDKNVPERVWTTEVVVAWRASEPPRFSARLLVSTPEHDPDFVPHTPGFVRQVAEESFLAAGPGRLLPDASVYSSEAEGHELADHLIDPKRQLPTIVVTIPFHDAPDHATLDTAALSRALLGLAHIAIAYPDAAWALTQRFGKYRSVFGGAVRVYLPGFDERDDPYAHRLVLADQITTQPDAERLFWWLGHVAARESVKRTKLGSDVLSFAEIRDASLSLKQQALKDEGASDADQLAAAETRIEALHAQLARKADEQNYYVEEWERERNRAELAEAQAQKASYRIQELTRLLKERGDDPDEGIAPPSAWADLAEWCDVNLAGRLVLTTSANRGARNPEFKDIAMVARCLLWLATSCRDQRIAGGEGSLRDVPIEDGVRNAPCGGDTYQFDWNGRRLAADWHIKNGGNTRDPSRCLRIYYCFDAQTQQIIVSDMPAHRRTSAS